MNTHEESPIKEAGSPSKRVAVIGAGPTGLTAAKHLADAGYMVDLLERTDRVGGLHRSVEIDGLHYDVGTFVFFEGHGLIEAFPSVKPMMVPINYAPRSITPKGNIDRYPFTFRRYLKDNGSGVGILSIANLLVAKARFRNPQTVPEFAYYYMGRTLYETSGLKQYIKRLHGAEDRELDIEFAKLRMPAVSAMSFRNIVSKRFRRFKNRWKGKKTRSLKDRTARPATGFNPFYAAIRDEIESAQVNLRLSVEVESIRRQDDYFAISINGTTEQYDRVISTLPIPVALRLCGLPSNDVTETRDLVSLFYRGKLAVDGPVIFNFTSESEWKRITVFSRFYETPEDGRDYFTVEITGSDSSPDTIEACRRDFEQHAAKVNLLEGPPELVGNFHTPRAYPVYRKGTTEQLNEDKSRLADFGIDSIGRQGAFEYVISHFVALSAKKLTSEIVAKDRV